MSDDDLRELPAATERLRHYFYRGLNDPDPYAAEEVTKSWHLGILARAYLAAADRPGWCNIITAPKDGTLFLAYALPGQHGLPELYSLCSWHPGAGFCICELREATHWQPLPPPPE